MSTIATRFKQHQERWGEVVRDPALQDLPYEVETNARGQIILSPHTARHSRQQKAIMKHLDTLLPEGEAFQEYPIATSQGVKQVDVIWASESRLSDMDETGDPPARAPEICVEVMSESNTEEEMREKRGLFLEIGAEEVWIVSEDGEIRFFGEDELEHSELVPECPSTIKP